MSKPCVLVLFDVDGTLLVTGGATTRCIHRAMAAIAGRSLPDAKITVGLLDSEIFFELAIQYGLETAEDQFQTFKDLYLVELEEELRNAGSDVRTLPGVLHLISTLRERPDVVLGILTGNFESAARMKLRAAGLDPGSFPISAYAEDGAKRSDLVHAAMRRLDSLITEQAHRCRTTGFITPGQVVIVGDTPRDIACAAETGCRVLAVATGYYSVEKLRECAPDRVVADLTDATPLTELITLASAG